MRGYVLSTETYEELPRYVPTAKLHCSSCHLNAGGNADAAWWVNLRDKYPAPPDLQSRINNCFTNSLNGTPLCTPASLDRPGTCDSSPDMQAFTAYMRWLDEQAARLPLCGTVKHGYPSIAALTGNAARGAETFTQKCAVCHGADGQGRYEGGSYFRPALWGPRSFNLAAGMFAHPAFLAAFVRWNMPYTSGGALTDQEAWDLQAFIHSKARPARKDVLQR